MSVNCCKQINLLVNICRWYYLHVVLFTRDTIYMWYYLPWLSVIYTTASRYGILYHLLFKLFHYKYTMNGLEESDGDLSKGFQNKKSSEKLLLFIVFSVCGGCGGAFFKAYLVFTKKVLDTISIHLLLVNICTLLLILSFL